MKYPTKYWKFTKDASGQIKKELVEKDGSMDYVQQVKTKTLWYEYYDEPLFDLNSDITNAPANADTIHNSATFKKGILNKIFSNPWIIAIGSGLIIAFLAYMFGWI